MTKGYKYFGNINFNPQKKEHKWLSGLLLLIPVAPWFPAMYLFETFDMFPFDALGFPATGDIEKQNAPEEAQPINAEVQKVELLPAAFGKPVRINGVVADAVLENIVVRGVTDFVEVVQLFVLVGVAVKHREVGKLVEIG